MKVRRARAPGARWAPALLASAALAVSGCSADPPPPRWGVVALPGTGLAALQTASGDVVAVDVADGEVRWRHPSPSSRAAGTPGTACPPRLASNQTLFLAFPDRIVGVDAVSGAPRFTHASRAYDAVCMAAAPDSGVLVPSGDEERVLSVTKLDAEGAVAWRFTVPAGAGPIVDGLEVSPGTGDVMLRTATHVLNVSPAGRLNWQVLLADYEPAGGP